MPVILPRGKEVRWLKPTNSLTEILGALNKFPSDLMDAYPISKEIEQPGPYLKDILISKGERLFSTIDLPAISRSKYHHSKKKSDVSHLLGNTPI